jgi:hypothetical protein
MIKCKMKVQEKWLFCYWDEPIFEKEVKKTNNIKTKDNGTTSNTNRKKDSNQTKGS